MALFRLLVGLISAVAVAVSPAGAQSRVAVITSASASNPNSIWLFNLPSQRVEAVVPLDLGKGVFTSSGRFFVAVNNDQQQADTVQLRVADLGRGTITSDSLSPFTGAHVVANPRNNDVYAVLVAGAEAMLMRVRFEDLTVLRRAAPTPPAVSRDGRRVFIYDWLDGLVWIDAETGATVDHFDIGGIGALSTDAAGGTVLVARPTGLSVVDVAARAIVRTAPLPLSPGMSFSRVLGDGPDAGGYFLHGSSPGGRETVLVDPVALTARQVLPLPPNREVLSLKVLPDHRTALVGSTTGLEAMVDAVDLPGNQHTFSTSLFAAWQFASLTTTSAPLAPSSVQASVTGSQVTLTWQLPPSSDGVSAWIVEAGSSRGVTDLAEIRLAPGESSLVVPGVPPGRYFVRVRAINFTGTGAVSNEVVIDVPAVH